MLVSRAIGRISPANDTEHTAEIRELQKAIIEEITEDSELSFEHYTNILQHQIDGGLVGIVTKEIDDIPIIETKARDVYFPHDDGRGADIALVEKYPDHEANQQEDEEDPDLIEYLHIYRERIERSKERDKETKKRKSKLICTHILYKIKAEAALRKLRKKLRQKCWALRNWKPFMRGDPVVLSVIGRITKHSVSRSADRIEKPREQARGDQLDINSQCNRIPAKRKASHRCKQADL